MVLKDRKRFVNYVISDIQLMIAMGYVGVIKMAGSNQVELSIDFQQTGQYTMPEKTHGLISNLNGLKIVHIPSL